MKLIELHGVLADKFGKYFKLDVQTAREAAHALGCMLPGFKSFMLSSEQNGLRYAVFLDKTDDKYNIGESQLDNITSADTIHIMPKLIGAGGVLEVVTGAVMVGIGVFTGNPMLIAAGVGVAIGGVATMLMPNPTIETDEPDGNRANYGFGSAVTTVAQGNVVPKLIGERLIGGFIASVSIDPEDQQ